MSRQLGEALAGTAVASTHTWLLLPVAGDWAADAIESQAISPRLREQLRNWLGAAPGRRLQLLRRPRQRASNGGRRVFVAYTGGTCPGMAATAYADEATLAALDFDALAAAATRTATRFTRQLTEDAPRWLVCTHGRRDRCCAKWGVPLFEALLRLDPQGTWQTSHLGGHRFAPTALSLPFGYSYGRLRVEDLPSLVIAHQRDQLHDIKKLRGRTVFTAAQQVAEIALLTKLKCNTPAAFAVSDDDDQHPLEHTDQWVVLMRDRQGQRYRVTLEQRQLRALRPTSCNTRAVEVLEWQVTHLEHVSPQLVVLENSTVSNTRRSLPTRGEE